MGGEEFKKRLARSALSGNNYGLKQLCTTVKSFIANVVKCKAHNSI